MKMRAWHTMDKVEWGPGPWNTEPDKAQWVDPTTGLDCLIVRNQSGALCGYVGVPPGHRAHGLFYDDVDVDVHGGLTYAAHCQKSDDPSRGICHVPEEGRPDDVWWLGFDCAHAWDLVPGYWKLLARSSDEVYREFDWVVAEVRGLAAQLADAS